MSGLARILTVNSLRELLRYRSFFLLVFVIIVADQAVHRLVDVEGLDVASGLPRRWGADAARYAFETLPGVLAGWLLNWRAALVAAGLFLLKQVVSLWPSSDMRRMHRAERGGFGLAASLAAIRLDQAAWDAAAVLALVVALGVWLMAAFCPARLLWAATRSPHVLLLPAVAALVAAPLAMAGLSYSSKLAVLSRVSLGRRFRLFGRLVTDGGLLWRSWVFFAVRIGVEFVFVAAIPAWAIVSLQNAWLRIGVAALSATPVYAYLKMATFKFFLQAYRDCAEVRAEYGEYFGT